MGLTDATWQRAERADDFHGLTRKRPAPLKTTAFLLYDAKNVYVALRPVSVEVKNDSGMRCR